MGAKRHNRSSGDKEEDSSQPAAGNGILFRIHELPKAIWANKKMTEAEVIVKWDTNY